MVFGIALRRREPLTEQETERLELEEELRHTREQLQRAFRAFNQVTDPDLIEAWNYEINAQQARYNYLLRQWKTLEEGGAEEAGA